jgi:phosphoribosyl-AMP cyclohydrolase / phosphoribosyl-ATP pyrophosphohydrolase
VSERTPPAADSAATGALPVAIAQRVKWDAQGLVPAIAQDRLDGRVLMMAWMDAAALAATLRTRRATFWSRSRGRAWTKGETSGHFLEVAEVVLDCDGDTIVLLVEPRGPACHTGAETCFVCGIEGAGVSEVAPVAPLLRVLEREIEARKASDAGKSYTRSLLDGGAEKIGAKLREEADELARAIAGESDERVASEAADVVYHLMVGLASRGVSMRAVLAALDARRGTSGHEEKRRRG